MGARLKPVTVVEIRRIKLLQEKGFDNYQISDILGRSYSTVCRVTNGSYDYMLNEQAQGTEAEQPQASQGESRTVELLEEIIDDLHGKNTLLSTIMTLGNKQIEAQTKSIIPETHEQVCLLNQIVGALSNQYNVLHDMRAEIKVQTACMGEILLVLKDIKKQLDQPQPVAVDSSAPDADPPKYPGEEFAEWGEVVRRLERYDKFIAESLRGVKARKDGTTLYLICAEPAKNFLRTSPVGIPRIKQQCRNVTGFGVEVKLLDQ